MLARFFIDRPVLAWVISLVAVLLGGSTAVLLPIAEYPELSPPPPPASLPTSRPPEAGTASTHGGVRPWWLQGSSVT